MESLKIAYIVILNLEDGGYLGGIMVVDRRGLPLEFHYTEKVNPTKIQKILYGSVLSKFIKENVIGENLAKAIKTKADLLILSDAELEIEETGFNVPVVYLEKTKAETLNPPQKSPEANASEVIFQPNKYKHPFKVRFLNVEGEAQKKVVDKLMQISETLDLLEPITRIKEALNAIAKEADSGGD